MTKDRSGKDNQDKAVSGMDKAQVYKDDMHYLITALKRKDQELVQFERELGKCRFIIHCCEQFVTGRGIKIEELQKYVEDEFKKLNAPKVEQSNIVGLDGKPVAVVPPPKD